MDKKASHTVGRALWFITGTACLCVGLGVLGVDVLGLLHLNEMNVALRSMVGFCGVASLAMFFMKCSGKCSSKC